MRLLFLILFLLLAGCAQQQPEEPHSPPAETLQQKHSSYDLPITKRDFYMGMVPTPKNSGSASFDDIAAAYEEVGSLGEVAMVWVDPSGIGQYEKLKQNKVVTAMRVYGLKPVITLSFWTIEEVPGEGLKVVVYAPDGVEKNLSDPEFRRLWVSEARSIADEYQPEYLSLGNEINDYFYHHPDDFDSYISLFDEAYAEIKQVSPETKVFAVFSYNHMLENGQTYMIEKFDNRADLIGLTTYPWQTYGDPGEIPEDYYSRLNDYTDKPIAFTEVGWTSSPESGSSEKEQADFLVRFLELNKDNNIEMINWLFLHEMAIDSSITRSGTGTISLKNTDGSKKEIYDVWLDLQQVELEK